MSSFQEIDTLLEVAPVKRDNQWENSFLQILPSLNFEMLNEAPQTGPDGWPYMMVTTSPQGSQSATKVLGWLSEKGIGLAINANKPAPDFVLTYGMIWNYRETAKFFTDIAPIEAGRVALEAGTEVIAGAPTREYLPDYVRAVLRSFFKDNQIEKMKILVMGKVNQPYDLCFSAECLGNPPNEEAQNVLEALSWFLPPHYSLMVVSEQGLPPFHIL